MPVRRPPVLSLLSTAAALGAAIALPAVSTPAAASSPAATGWTVKAGSASTGATVAFTAQAAGASFVLRVDGSAISCTSTPLSAGTLKVGTYASGRKLLTQKPTTSATCQGAAGVTYSITSNSSSAFNATRASGDVVTGTISGIALHVVKSGGGCTFDVTGTVPASYDDSTQVLTVPGTTSPLTLSAVNGCFGTFANGDKASISDRRTLTAGTSRYNPITITTA